MVQIKLKRLQVMKPVNLGFRVLGKWRATTGMICPAGWRPGEEMHSSQVAHRDGSRLSRNTGCMQGSTPGSTSTPLLAHTDTLDKCKCAIRRIVLSLGHLDNTRECLQSSLRLWD